MEKLLTKNLAISILAGISIIGGAFWVHHSNNATVATYGDNNTANNSSVASADNSQGAIIRDLTPAATAQQADASGTAIQVADLPLANNGLPNQGPSAASILLGASAQTGNGSTLAYDDIKDKSVLYTDGGVSRYSSTDIKSQITGNRAALLAYGTNLVKILGGYPFYTDKNPTEITFDIYSNKDISGTELSELEAVRSSYETLAKRLLIINVPKDLLDMHIKLINTADRISQLIENMKKVQTDKLLALNCARQYVEEAKFMVETLVQISQYLGSKNIDFGKDNKLKLAVDVIN